GYTPERINTSADVHLDANDLEIKRVELDTEAKVPDIGENEFMDYAEEAKNGCPVSKALKGPKIELSASLL
ncbi:MAG: OsmC family protein, partial [Halobacteria archaeon]|nr:OsmC family protein [Halobacteria archaeon]